MHRGVGAATRRIMMDAVLLLVRSPWPRPCAIILLGIACQILLSAQRGCATKHVPRTHVEPNDMAVISHDSDSALNLRSGDHREHGPPFDPHDHSENDYSRDRHHQRLHNDLDLQHKHNMRHQQTRSGHRRDGWGDGDAGDRIKSADHLLQNAERGTKNAQRRHRNSASHRVASSSFVSKAHHHHLHQAAAAAQQQRVGANVTVNLTANNTGATISVISQVGAKAGTQMNATGTNLSNATSQTQAADDPNSPAVRNAKLALTHCRVFAPPNGFANYFSNPLEVPVSEEATTVTQSTTLDAAGTSIPTSCPIAASSDFNNELVVSENQTDFYAWIPLHASCMHLCNPGHAAGSSKSTEQMLQCDKLVDFRLGDCYQNYCDPNDIVLPQHSHLWGCVHQSLNGSLCRAQCDKDYESTVAPRPFVCFIDEEVRLGLWRSGDLNCVYSVWAIIRKLFTFVCFVSLFGMLLTLIGLIPPFFLLQLIVPTLRTVGQKGLTLGADQTKPPETKEQKEIRDLKFIKRSLSRRGSGSSLLASPQSPAGAPSSIGGSPATSPALAKPAATGEGETSPIKPSGKAVAAKPKVATSAGTKSSVAAKKAAVTVVPGTTAAAGLATTSTVPKDAGVPSGKAKPKAATAKPAPASSTAPQAAKTSPPAVAAKKAAAPAGGGAKTAAAVTAKKTTAGAIAPKAKVASSPDTAAISASAPPTAAAAVAKPSAAVTTSSSAEMKRPSEQGADAAKATAVASSSSGSSSDDFGLDMPAPKKTAVPAAKKAKTEDAAEKKKEGDEEKYLEPSSSSSSSDELGLDMPVATAKKPAAANSTDAGQKTQSGGSREKNKEESDTGQGAVTSSDDSRL
ncbi:unnamed protein product [Amoebophrya sp. A120]|nr:unnamed protein product [Amoebophrya sp. A120]|eukprot:GSA120T00006351001.1